MYWLALTLENSVRAFAALVYESEYFRHSTSIVEPYGLRILADSDKKFVTFRHRWILLNESTTCHENHCFAAGGSLLGVAWAISAMPAGRGSVLLMDLPPKSGPRARLVACPRAFFARLFVLNYCPLCFLEESGRNRTPDKLARAEQQALFDICDRALASSIACLSPRLVVGIGQFAANRARLALDGVEIDAAPHPSPANPNANRDWTGQMSRALAALGVRGAY